MYRSTRFLAGAIQGAARSGRYGDERNQCSSFWVELWVEADEPIIPKWFVSDLCRDSAAL
jgi:hypothetical protein